MNSKFRNTYKRLIWAFVTEGAHLLLIKSHRLFVIDTYEVDVDWNFHSTADDGFYDTLKRYGIFTRSI